jgi:glycine/D-amino acid oxidase-like deaminating enzyme
VAAQVYRVQGAEGVLYVRIAEEDHEDLSVDAALLEHLRAQGLHVPPVVHVEPFDQALGRSLLIMGEIPGADGQPVIDRVPGLDNAWVSAGHDGDGLLMAPATGQALATWITTGHQPKEVLASGSPDSTSPADRPEGPGWPTRRPLDRYHGGMS